MNYSDYIKLGFTRHDTDDAVEFNQTGYGSFYLSFELNSKASIQVYCWQLDKPKLYVKKPKEDRFYITQLTDEQLINLTKIK
jgi:hypothetical protein